MMQAETWLGERMTVRRWLAVLCGVAVLAVVVAAVAVAAWRSAEDGGAGYDGPAAALPAGVAEQRPTSMDVVVNVGSFSDLDGRAAVTLDVFPTASPVRWTVTVRALPPAPGSGPAGAATVREIDLTEGEARTFATALDAAVRHPRPRHRPDRRPLDHPRDRRRPRRVPLRPEVRRRPPPRRRRHGRTETVARPSRGPAGMARPPHRRPAAGGAAGRRGRRRPPRRRPARRPATGRGGNTIPR